MAPAHPIELTYPCCLPTLGELGEVPPRGEPSTTLQGGGGGARADAPDGRLNRSPRAGNLLGKLFVKQGEPQPEGNMFGLPTPTRDEAFAEFVRGASPGGDILPKGAEDLKLELASAQGDWGEAQLGQRKVYVVTFPAVADKPISSISYMGVDGDRVSLRMP